MIASAISKKTKKISHGRPATNLIGRRFDKLYVFAQAPSSHGYGHSWAICDCGVKKKVSNHTLLRENTRSCGCAQQFLTRLKRPLLPPKILTAREKLAAYKTRAKRRGIQWAISDQLFDELIHLNCHWCGSPPMSKYYNGVDRLLSDLGYLETNVVPCCGTCNLMKRIMTPYQFLEHIRKIYEHQRLLEKLKDLGPQAN